MRELKIINSTPKKDKFYMPAEFSLHDGTFMVYPWRAGSWGKDRTKALKAFRQIFKEILKRENLYLFTATSNMDKWTEIREMIEGIEKELGSSLKGESWVTHVETDDAWARDIGPTFVTDKVHNVRGINWSFNAWGGKVDGLYALWDKDDMAAKELCRIFNMECYDASPFVLEGGSIHSDGEGTVMVTESCLLSKGRNPSMSKAEIEEKLKEYLGAEKVLWLPRGIYNDETNEHVDNVAAFTAPGEIVLAWTDNEDDPQYELSKADLDYLESVTDAKGRKLKIHKLPIPDHPVCVNVMDLANYEFEEGEDTREVGERLAASYVNFYFINGAVLLPQFGGENTASDRRAIEIMSRICPDREIIGIDARAILLGGGNIHCITQQIPADVNGYKKS